MLIQLTENRKEYKYYFQGPFWIIADNVVNIISGKDFELLAVKYLCDYNGDYINDQTSKSSKSHKKYWTDEVGNLEKFQGTDWDYYPRGRVAIYDGKAYIHINSKCNNPNIIDTIIKEYGIGKLEIEVEENDVTQGSHYDFKLK